MKNVVRLEIKKAIFSKYFLIAVALMTLFAILSGIYMIEGRYGYNPTAITAQYAGETITTNPDVSLFGFYDSWVGGEMLSLAQTLFFNLLPIGAALPFAWSFCKERKSGYIKNIASRAKKEYYYYGKTIAVFLSGVLAVLIPILINILMVSAFIPACKPFAWYIHYNHLYFGNMWADLLYTHPVVYTALYVILEAFYGGVFSLLSLAVTFYVNNIFAVQLFPFLLMLGGGFLQNLIFSNLGEVIWLQFIPTDFIHSRCVNGQVLPWVVVLVTSVLLLFSIGTIIIRGKKDEIF